MLTDIKQRLGRKKEEVKEMHQKICSRKKVGRKTLADMWRMYLGKFAGVVEVSVLYRFFKINFPEIHELTGAVPADYLQFWSENLNRYFPNSKYPHLDITSGQAMEVFVKQHRKPKSIKQEVQNDVLKIYNVAEGLNAVLQSSDSWRLITDEDEIFKTAIKAKSVVLSYTDLAKDFIESLNKRGVDLDDYHEEIVSLRGKFKTEKDFRSYIGDRLCL